MHSYVQIAFIITLSRYDGKKHLQTQPTPRSMGHTSGIRQLQCQLNSHGMQMQRAEMHTYLSLALTFNVHCVAHKENRKPHP